MKCGTSRGARIQYVSGCLLGRVGVEQLDPMLKILIADDHAIVRRGLRDILREAAEPATVGEAGTGLEALEKAQSEAWDVIVLDITMPDMSGLEVLKRLKKAQPALQVLMLSMHSSEQYVQSSLKAGAAGYLSKESAPEELIIALHAILAGKRYLSRSLAERVKLVVCSVSSARNSLRVRQVGGSVGHPPHQERSHARSQTQAGQVETKRCH